MLPKCLVIPFAVVTKPIIYFCMPVVTDYGHGRKYLKCPKIYMPKLPVHAQKGKARNPDFFLFTVCSV